MFSNMKWNVLRLYLLKINWKWIFEIDLKIVYQWIFENLNSDGIYKGKGNLFKNKHWFINSRLIEFDK